MLGCDKPKPAAPRSTIDLSSPKAAAKSFMASAAGGDMVAARQCIVPGRDQQPLVEGFVSFASGAKKMMDALHDRFGQTLTSKTAAQYGGSVLDAGVIDRGRVVELENVAGIELPPVKLELRKVAGKWKIDYLQSFKVDPGNVTAFRNSMLAVGKAAEQIADEIRSGKYATYREAENAIESKLEAAASKAAKNKPEE